MSEKIHGSANAHGSMTSSHDATAIQIPAQARRARPSRSPAPRLCDTKALTTESTPKRNAIGVKLQMLPLPCAANATGLTCATMNASTNCIIV